MTTADIAANIAIAMRGENLREFRGESGEVAVRVAFREDEKQSDQNLEPQSCRNQRRQLIRQVLE